MSFNLKCLRAFTHALEFGSITAAADKLNLSPPAVSRLIAQLEFEIQLKLFDRTHRGLLPTEAAHLFVREAQRLLADLEELPEMARRIKRRTVRRLRILTTPRLLPGLIIPSLAKMNERFTEVNCALDVQPKWELERSLAHQRYDICTAILPVPNHSLTVEPLFRIAAEALLQKSHFLAKRKTLTARDLEGERMIGFLPGQFLRRQMSDFFRDAGVDMEFSMEISTSTVAADLTRKGCGITVADRLACTGLNMQGLVSVPLEPRLWTTAGVFFSKDNEIAPFARSFVDCMVEVLMEFSLSPENAKVIEVFKRAAADSGRSWLDKESVRHSAKVQRRRTPTSV
jgi:DNA-binding transcriptional LysR family regulator